MLLLAACQTTSTDTKDSSNDMIGSDDANNIMQGNSSGNDSMINDIASDNITDNITRSGGMMDNTEVKTFILAGENYKFVMDGADNPTLTVNKGDKVRIEFSSTQGFHNWVLDEFGASTDKISEGHSTSVEFVADKTGSFEYYCGVGSHRVNGMWGQFIVK